MIITQLTRRLSPQVKLGIINLARRFSIGRALLRWYDQQCIEVYLISFPKCGRTWLSLMLAKSFATYLGVEVADILNLRQFSGLSAKIPVIKVDHDDGVHFKRPSELSATKVAYRGKKVVLLIRDMRDVAISCYFEYTRRRRQHGAGFSSPSYEGDLSSFLRHDVGSVDTFIQFYNIWAENQGVPAGFLLVRYEDMRVAPAGELRRVLDFVGLVEISDGIVQQAVKYASFDRMHELEQSDAFGSPALSPGDKEDAESYKTRRGVVGGFVDYLTQADIDYLNTRIQALSSFYGYIPQVERRVR